MVRRCAGRVRLIRPTLRSHESSPQIALRSRRLQTRMRSSRHPAIRTPGRLRLQLPPYVKREQIDSLHGLGFVERKENIVFLGPPGVGKTHLAISLAIATARAAARSTTAPLTDLIDSLEEARAVGRLNQRVKILTHSALLVIDEIGYLSVTRRGPHPLLPIRQPPLRARLDSAHLKPGLRAGARSCTTRSWPPRCWTGCSISATSSTSAANSYRMRRHAELSKAIHPTAARARGPAMEEAPRERPLPSPGPPRSGRCAPSATRAPMCTVFGGQECPILGGR